MPTGPCRVVLTGGPSGGKSTLRGIIEEQIPEAFCAPEVATILLSGGFPTPTERHPWDAFWQRDLQVAVAASQLALENITQRRAKTESRQILVFDRGMLDGAAYLQDGIAELEQISALSEQQMLDRYDLVLHLATTASHNAYDKHSNPHRFEEALEALRLEERILAAWGNHANRIVLDATDQQQRLRQGLQIIKDQIG